jgi:predicted PurR-regulated permease PerM
MSYLIFKIGLAAVCVFLLALILAPFVSILFMTALLAITFFPVFLRIKNKLPKSDSVAAVLTVVFIAVILAAPLTVVVYLLIKESTLIMDAVNSGIKTGELQAYWKQLKGAGPLGYLFKMMDSYIDLPEVLGNNLQQASGFVLSWTSKLAKGFAEFLVGLVITLFATYYFLKDGRRIKKVILDLLPIPEMEKGLFLSRFEEMIKATIYGGIVIAMAQGALGGVIFWVLGIPSPVVWGTIMVFASFIPFGGTGLVWAPASVYLFFQGSILKGLVLIALGLGMIGTIDNILRPYVMSTQTNIHPLILFFAVIGGISAFGLIGIFVGPLIMTLVLAFYELYLQRR